MADRIEEGCDRTATFGEVLILSLSFSLRELFFVLLILLSSPFPPFPLVFTNIDIITRGGEKRESYTQKNDTNSAKRLKSFYQEIDYHG